MSPAAMLTPGEEQAFGFNLRMVALRAEYPEARRHQPGAAVHGEGKPRGYTTRLVGGHLLVRIAQDPRALRFAAIAGEARRALASQVLR